MRLGSSRLGEYWVFSEFSLPAGYVFSELRVTKLAAAYFYLPCISSVTLKSGSWKFEFVVSFCYPARVVLPSSIYEILVIPFYSLNLICVCAKSSNNLSWLKAVLKSLACDLPFVWWFKRMRTTQKVVGCCYLNLFKCAGSCGVEFKLIKLGSSKLQLNFICPNLGSVNCTYVFCYKHVLKLVTLVGQFVKENNTSYD